MFVRKKKNRSGSVSVVVTSKEGGKFKELKTIGVSSDPLEIDRLYREGKLWIEQRCGYMDMFALQDKEDFQRNATEYFFNQIENVILNGPQLVLEPVFNLIGFDKLGDPILKHLVISRISKPLSKLATADYLKSYFDEDVKLYKIYRYLDDLNDTLQEKIQEISVNHTRKILGGKIGLVFYDVTTLYFETDYPDDLRRTGFSKDGKHSLPQIVLGLLVSMGGYPLAYSIHEGNKYEGHTMLPIIKEFVKKFELTDFVIVADSGLMNNDNLEELEEMKYKYIIGARIKNEQKDVVSWIHSLKKADGVFYEHKKTKKRRLIVGYSDARAKKDAYNRDKGIRRLEKEYKNNRITKEKINKKGYNKFLKLSDDIEVSIDYDKIKEDEKWDGLKGYITNTKLPPKTVSEEYSELWQVERAFRISKGTLELRPMFHFTKKRIEAHVCICFVAYKVYKELERILTVADIKLSVDKVLDIAKTITTISFQMPQGGGTITKTMLLTDRHKMIRKLFEPDFWNDIATRIE